MMFTGSFGAVAAVAVVAFAGPAAGSVFLELDPGTGHGPLGGPGTGRSMYLTADTTFSIKSVGIFGDLVMQSFDVVIYEGLGVDAPAGAELHSISAESGGLGAQWNDLAISFSFDAAMDYIVNWRPTDGNDSWGVINQFVGWGNLVDDDVDLGVVTIRDGREGFNAESFDNTHAPFMRLGIIPSPSALAALGLALFANRRRR